MYPLNTQKTPKIRKSVRTSLKKDLRCRRCLLLEKKRDSATQRISLQKITKKTKIVLYPSKTFRYLRFLLLKRNPPASGANDPPQAGYN